MSFLKRFFRPQPTQPRQQAPPSACPYCGAVLDPAPERNRKCPHCGERIVVRTRRSDGAKVLLTEAGAREFDKERKQEAARNKALRRAQNIGASESDFQRVERELAEKWGYAPPRDVFWRLASEAAMAAMRTGDEHQLSMVYWEQARLLFEEGREHLQIQREAEKAALHRYAEDGVSRVEISAGECAVCRADDGRRFSVSDALEKLPIPKEHCENGWCKCTWLPVVESGVGYSPPGAEPTWVFLGHEELASVAKLRREGKLDEAEAILLTAEPTPAVLDELRKVASIRARSAKQEDDWATVVRHLEGYTALANKCRAHCIKVVNAEPPGHTPKDQKLLEEAKTKLGK